jgi:peptide/nickel transport system permease protein
MVVACLGGVALGVLAAVRQNRFLDHLIRFLAIGGISMPAFWLGLLLQVVVFGGLGLFELTGRLDPDLEFTQPLREITGFHLIDAVLTGNGAALADAASHLVLPALTLAAYPLGVIARMTRASMLEALAADHIRAARAFGIPERVVSWRIALRNALPPAATVAGLTLATPDRAFFVEVVFNWRLGQFAATTAQCGLSSDHGITLFGAIGYLVVNLAVTSSRPGSTCGSGSREALQLRLAGTGGASNSQPDAAGSATPPARTRQVLRAVTRDRLALIGAFLVALLILAAVFGPWLAPNPEQGAGLADVAHRNLAPGSAHWLGTDPLGRDLLSRVIIGARPALVTPLVVVALAVLIGVPLGLMAGYRGGWVDAIVMRVADMFLAFPPLLLAMVIVALLGPSLLNAALALALAWWPWYARLVRGLAASLRNQPFVEGARALGLRDVTILSRHVLPNAAAPVIVQATIDVGTVILAVGSLAFLGLGAQPPTPDWGLMVAEGRTYVLSQWWLSAVPGTAIFLAVLGFNLLGDALRDVLDPRSVAR